MKILNYRTIGVLTVFLSCISNQLLAKTKEEILSTYNDPTKIGHAITVEADNRDDGFGDLVVEMEMILRNSHGQETRRSQRNKTLEISNPDLGDKSLIIFDNPRDIKGTAFLTFSKILEADDQWLYLPSLKRVKRISSKNKSGPFMGSEFAYEDISSPEVGKFSYKYIKIENYNDMECFVVEKYPLYQYSGYTKQVTWIDTKEFLIHKIDFYDRKNDLLKTLTYHGYNPYTTQGRKYWRADKFLMVNYQNNKTTDVLWKNYKFGTGLKESDFTKSNLKSTR